MGGKEFDMFCWWGGWLRLSVGLGKLLKGIFLVKLFRVGCGFVVGWGVIDWFCLVLMVCVGEWEFEVFWEGLDKGRLFLGEIIRLLVIGLWVCFCVCVGEGRGDIFFDKIDVIILLKLFFFIGKVLGVGEWMRYFIFFIIVLLVLFLWSGIVLGVGGCKCNWDVFIFVFLRGFLLIGKFLGVGDW